VGALTVLAAFEDCFLERVSALFDEKVLPGRVNVVDVLLGADFFGKAVATDALRGETFALVSSF